MFIKTKKQNQDGIVRLESSGEIKEVIINEDFLHPNKASIAVCFRGKDSSGILELTPEEVDFINKKVAPRAHLLKGVKVLRFEK
ncbi:MAG TPA: hypothetical protein VJH92_04250 [Candidatus Nanoarchaeia archaeon]|nr:hypothetical protein [Candidatus Nanoarchaeia archaeon]